jgi:hypothetical protein
MEYNGISEILRERASANWATPIFRQASKPELDNFRFLASEMILAFRKLINNLEIRYSKF